MKKILISLLLFLSATTMMAIPAKPGLWRTLRLTDGTEVRAQLCGDEHLHFWMTADGQRLLLNEDDIAVPMQQEQATARALKHQAKRAASNKRKIAIGEKMSYTGKKRGLVILVEYTDVKFRSTNDQALYKRILNEEGFSEGNFRGSVTDYFKAQSGGLFELTFDVVGPYTLKNNQAYYGSNDAYGDDMRPWEMITEACQQADSEVNFADYDWDGDGEAEEVFVVYAGKGEADGGSKNTVWPHMWSLVEATGQPLVLDKTTIDIYACSNELASYNAIEGIGTFCHEFSHCLGFPDFYDISYSGLFGMDDFDLMCGGSYGGNGFIPSGYTGYEKMMAGWLEPVVLKTDTSIVNVAPLSQGGQSYIIYNDAHPDEYYMLENRQLVGWDAALPGKGLMITHVDFDLEVWLNNIPNSIFTEREAAEEGLSCGNDHQRMTIFHADNTASVYTTSTDLYPYQRNDSLTATSRPAASLYNKNTDGTKKMGKSVLNIKQNNDKSVNFSFRIDPKNTTPADTVSHDYLFYESFDQCNGTGGNDGQWNGNIANKALVADNEGWSAMSDKMYGAYQCAKFGTSSVMGMATTPTFDIDGEATLTFKASPWDVASEDETLIVTASGVTITPASFQLAKGEWTECTATLKGNGSIDLTFMLNKRFFLDEVRVTEGTTNGISTTQMQADSRLSNRIYTPDGRFVGTRMEGLKHGVYIMNGKKFIK